MPRSAVEVVALRVPSFLLPREAGPETAGRVRSAGTTIALAVGPGPLVFAPVGLGLL